MVAGRRPASRAHGAGGGRRDGAAGAGARPGAGARTGTRPAPAVAGRPSRPAPAPRPTRTRRLVVLGAVLVVLAVLLAPALRSYVGQRQDVSALEQQVAEQRAAVKLLERQRAAWDDPAYVTAQARNRLKYVLPGEKAYTVIDPGPVPTTESASVRAAVSTANQDRSWFGNLWGSLQVVGHEQAPGR